MSMIKIIITLIGIIYSYDMLASNNLSIWVDDKDGHYYIGDSIAIHAKSNIDGYLTITSINEEGEKEVLFPNKHDPDNFIKKNTEIIIPKNSSYEIKASGLPGSERIVGVIQKLKTTDTTKSTNIDDSIFFKKIEISRFQKKALLIANSNYKEVKPLVAPKNDVEIVKKALNAKGYITEVLYDEERINILYAINNLVREIKSGVTYEGILYYTGHGININGNDFIVPIDFPNNKSKNINNLINITQIVNKIDNLNMIFSSKVGEKAFDGIFYSDFSKSIGNSISNNKKISSVDVYNDAHVNIKSKLQTPSFYKNSDVNYLINKERSPENISGLLVIFDACRNNKFFKKKRHDKR